jgi:hypothetical protein
MTAILITFAFAMLLGFTKGADEKPSEQSPEDEYIIVKVPKKSLNN